MPVKDGEWMDLRVRCKQVLSDGKLVVEILSMVPMTPITLIDDRDVVRTVKEREPR